ncbi:MAG TPA: PBP1A family penicillin-binding protein [Kofleriaceae bacterium]|nr:PBP1A family penicillin-binding protein [Kofleriaceae bacterium]
MEPARPTNRRRFASRIGLTRIGRKGRRSTSRMGSQRGPRTPRQKLFLGLKWGAIIGLALGAVGAGTLAMLFWIWGNDPLLPTIEKLSDYRPPQTSRVLAGDGKTVIGEIFQERRTVVKFSQMPKVLVQALISAEDADFFRHEGIDYLGMVRALLVDLREGHTVQGASTITQQVVKNLVLTPERALKRKVQEIILARRLEHSLSKNDILTLYANQINFGFARYGVQEASHYYFGKDVSQLNVGEAAVLAGLPQGPEILSPRKPENRERAKRRQIYVLQQMVANGYLAKDEAARWIAEPIRIVAEPRRTGGLAPEWVDVARQELVKRYGEEQVNKAGVDVQTSLDLKVQEAAREALRSGLRAYDKRQKYGVPVQHVKRERIDAELARMAQKLPRGGPVAGDEYRAIVTAVHDDSGQVDVDLGKWRASVALGGAADERFNPAGENGARKTPSERFGVGDVVRVMLPRGSSKGQKAETARKGETADKRMVELASGPEGAVVVIDPRSRRVLAVIGGYSYRQGDFNRATRAKRQAGSTFKPFVYAAAIDTGEMTPATLVNDAPEVYDLWKPENYEKGEFQGPVRLRHALARSINTVAIRVIHDIGPQRVVEMAHALGVESPLPAELSLALGSGVVTPIELTNAFASFAAGGKVAAPQALMRVGRDAVPAAQARQAIRPEVAYVILDMMRSVVTEGTAATVSGLKMDVAGKTGTSNDARDAWFVGMTSDLVVGVWVGFDDFRRELGRSEQGGHTAVPVFIDIMKKVGRRDSRFARPPGVVEARIDRASGLLAADNAPEGTFYTEVFLPGTVPTEVAAAPGEATADSYLSDAYDDVYGGDQKGGDGAGDKGKDKDNGKVKEKGEQGGGNEAEDEPGQ